MPLRPYDQDQMFLLPPSLNEWVRADHPARVFSEIIDRIDTTTFGQSKEEGRPAYHPAMMMKALSWGYATGVCSSRKIEERLGQDVVVMWLTGLEKPDFRTLCLFRTNNKEEDKIHGNNKRGYELPKQIEKAQDRIEIIEALIKKAHELEKQEESRVSPVPERYRVSLTDADAGFMHKGNTSLPAFNAQLAVTDEQLIVYADVTTEPVDVNQTKKAVEGIGKTVKEKLKIVVANTGYGRGNNFKYLKDDNIDGYIPSEDERHIGGKKRRKAEYLFAKEIFTYDAHRDKYRCPQGEKLRPAARTRIKSKYSKREIVTYRTERGACTACSLSEKCTTDVHLGMAITRDGYEEHRERMGAKINTAEGRAIYGK